MPALFETLRWTAPDAQLAALSSQPETCLTNDPRRALDIEVQAGHALFNSTALLGGQAAKSGLSCASCHNNGRDNPHFLMAGISDDPGTADVTNSFFSVARGNGRFDPVAIPDLAAPGKISRDPGAATLEPFLRTLIVEEFAGPEPSLAMLSALGAYVRAVRVCPDSLGQPVPRGLNDQLQLVQHAVAGAADMAMRGDNQASRALIAAARHQLGLISERYSGKQFGAERAQLVTASRSLSAIVQRPSSAADLATALSGWTQRFDAGLARQLGAKAPQSLYHPANLGFVALQRDNR